MNRKEGRIDSGRIPMSGVVRLSEAVSIAFHAAALMAAEGDRVHTTRDLAGRLGVSRAHLAKVMPRLAKAGLVRSTRGPAGGFRLARPAEATTFLEIYEALEGPVRGPGCPLKRSSCPFSRCLFGELAGEISADFVGYLGTNTLGSFVRGA
jgi:Rrf2 family protein